MALQPDDANAPLLVNANTVLAFLIAFKASSLFPGSVKSVRISGAPSNMSCFP